MMTEERTRLMIEKRLSMKNTVRNARIMSIAAQFDKQSYRELILMSPRRAETVRNQALMNGKR